MNQFLALAHQQVGPKTIKIWESIKQRQLDSQNDALCFLSKALSYPIRTLVIIFNVPCHIKSVVTNFSLDRQVFLIYSYQIIS